MKSEVLCASCIYFRGLPKCTEAQTSSIFKNMNPLQTRQKIISLLAEYFEPKPHVLAYWLGGSDANSESDEYSDLDIFLCVKDGEEKSVLAEAQNILETL